MKPQTSKSKLQGNGKPQTQKVVSGVASWTQPTIYPSPSVQPWVFGETPGSEPASKHPFDLEERTAKFGEAIIRFCRKIPRGPGNDRLIDQLVGCGTSVGANYCEANEKASKRDFAHSISRCTKEAKETKFFL